MPQRRDLRRQVPNAQVAVVTDRGGPAAVWGKGHALDVSEGRREVARLQAGLEVPQAQEAVVAPEEGAPAIGGQRQTQDRGAQVPPPQFAAGLSVPDANGFVPAS